MRARQFFLLIRFPNPQINANTPKRLKFFLKVSKGGPFIAAQGKLGVFSKLSVTAEFAHSQVLVFRHTMCLPLSPNDSCPLLFMWLISLGPSRMPATPCLLSALCDRGRRVLYYGAVFVNFCKHKTAQELISSEQHRRLIKLIQLVPCKRLIGGHVSE